MHVHAHVSASERRAPFLGASPFPNGNFFSHTTSDIFQVDNNLSRHETRGKGNALLEHNRFSTVVFTCYFFYIPTLHIIVLKHCIQYFMTILLHV